MTGPLNRSNNSNPLDSSADSGRTSRVSPCASSTDLFRFFPSQPEAFAKNLARRLEEEQSQQILNGILADYHEALSNHDQRELTALADQSGILPEVLILLDCIARQQGKHLIVRTSNPMNIPIYAALDHQWTAAKPMAVKAKSSPDLGAIPAHNALSKAFHESIRLQLEMSKVIIGGFEISNSMLSDADSGSIETLINAMKSSIASLSSNRKNIEHSIGQQSPLIYPATLTRQLLSQRGYTETQDGDTLVFTSVDQQRRYYARPAKISSTETATTATVSGNTFAVAEYAAHFHDTSDLRMIDCSDNAHPASISATVLCDEAGRLYVPDCDMVELARPLLMHSNTGRNVHTHSEFGFVTSGDEVFITLVKNACKSLDLPCPVLHGKEMALSFASNTDIPMQFPMLAFGGEHGPTLVHDEASLRIITGPLQPITPISDGRNFASMLS